MIQYLKGKIEFLDSKFLVIEVGSVGYKVFCSPDTLKREQEGQEVRIFTHLQVKEDALELYGFLSEEELELFGVLNGISGIGPKTAMMLASLGPLEKLRKMMEAGKLPPEIKGIGQKRMQKILLELTGKIKEIKPVSPDDKDVLDALISLGFAKEKAIAALTEIPQEEAKEERIKKAIKILGR